MSRRRLVLVGLVGDRFDGARRVRGRFAHGSRGFREATPAAHLRAGAFDDAIHAFALLEPGYPPAGLKRRPKLIEDAGCLERNRGDARCARGESQP